MLKFIKDKNHRLDLGVIVIFVVACLIPVFAPSDYWLHLFCEIFILALFATGFNLLYGYTGLLSFGQAAYYGIGAYTVALLVMKANCNFFLAIVAGVLLAAIWAAIIGPLCLRLRGVFFTCITLAFGMLVWGVIFKWYDFTGGDNGIQGIPVPGFLESVTNYYYFALIIAMAGIWFCSRIVRSPFGRTLQAIRQKEDRLGFVGINIKRHLLMVFVASGAVTGLAGGLFAGHMHSIHPSIVEWLQSGDVILMTVMGGIFSFFGPLIGAGIFELLKYTIGAQTEYWPICVGGAMIFVVIFLPKGLTGSIPELIRSARFRSKRQE